MFVVQFQSIRGKGFSEVIVDELDRLERTGDGHQRRRSGVVPNLFISPMSEQRLDDLRAAKQGSGVQGGGAFVVLLIQVGPGVYQRLRRIGPAKGCRNNQGARSAHGVFFIQIISLLDVILKGFEVSLNDDEIDLVIDRLRANGVSIRGITPRKLTLEESFIDVVKREGGE